MEPSGEAGKRAPRTLTTEAGLLKAKLEDFVLVGHVHARVVENRDIMPGLMVSEVKRAARVFMRAGHRLRQNVCAIGRVVAAQAVVAQRGSVRVWYKIRVAKVCSSGSRLLALERDGHRY